MLFLVCLLGTHFEGIKWNLLLPLSILFLFSTWSRSAFDVSRGAFDAVQGFNTALSCAGWRLVLVLQEMITSEARGARAQRAERPTRFREALGLQGKRGCQFFVFLGGGSEGKHLTGLFLDQSLIHAEPFELVFWF